MWVKRVLKGRAQHHTRVVFEDVFSAIAMMHIKINNSHSFDLVLFHGVRHAYRDIIKDTKPGTIGTASMMAGRAYTTKCVIHLILHDQVSGKHRRAASV
jgi:hypothetical protein